MKTRLVCAGTVVLALALLLATPLSATPLRLEYSVADLGGDVWQYCFSLILDNNDGTWTEGQGFNWIVFGDNPHQTEFQLTDWVGDVEDLPIGPFSVYSSTISYEKPPAEDHNGPTLLHSVGNNSADEGWAPAEVGDTLYWCGTSSADLRQGSLYFSNLRPVYYPDNRANFEVADRIGPTMLLIDIMPGDEDNLIKPRVGTIPVAILGHVNSTILSEITGLTFGVTGDENSLISCTGKRKDLRGDGIGDLICRFSTKAAGFQCGDTEGILRGYSEVDGTPFEGRQRVSVQCK